MKYPSQIYKYVGADKKINNMFFVRLAEFCSGKNRKPTKEKWPSEAEAWKYDLGKENIFLISIAENHLQPPHIQKIMSVVTELADDVEVSDDEMGGVIWMGSENDFSRDFKKIGK